jgi:hypothetical protein
MGGGGAPYGVGYWAAGSLLTRLCPRPLPLQQQVQHRKQQHAHSAPQHMHRAMQVTTDMTMRAPMMITTMTGHLFSVSKGEAA